MIADSKDITKGSTNKASYYQQGIKPTVIAEYRYPTRVRVERAASTMQLEKKQLEQPEPITYQTIDNITNPPNELKYKDLIKGPNQKAWKQGMCNELRRLSQGWKVSIGRNTIFFTHKSKIPKNKTVICGRICCDTRPQKTEVHRVRLTAGGNLIKYDGNTSTPKSGITTIKTH